MTSQKSRRLLTHQPISASKDPLHASSLPKEHIFQSSAYVANQDDEASVSFHRSSTFHHRRRLTGAGAGAGAPSVDAVAGAGAAAGDAVALPEPPTLAVARVVRRVTDMAGVLQRIKLY